MNYNRLLDSLRRIAMRGLGQSVFIKSLLYRVLWLLPDSMREQNLIRTTLKSLVAPGKPVFFVNIGANDGLAGDPLREFIVTKGWCGILVEPVDYVFQRLQKAYRNYPPPRIFLENAAIGDVTGLKKFWYLEKAPDMPPGYDQIGSFSKEHVLKHEALFPGLSKYLTSKDIPCITVRDLLAKHNVKQLDLVFIDTEGFDYEVLKQIDLSERPPKVIVYESAHLTPADTQAASQLLQSHGYKLSVESGDTVALLAREFP